MMLPSGAEPYELEPVVANPRVMCPICMDEYDWPERPQLYKYEDGDYVATAVSTAGGGTRENADLRRTYVRCPNPSDDLNTHYLPARYATFHKPLVIGMVGGSSSGKSHLLASMIGAVENDELFAFELNVRPLDHRQHAAFLSDTVRKLQQGGRLRGTLAQENAAEYADALLITSPRGSWPITFFDVAGGDLAEDRDNPTRFLEVASGLIFVVDPDKALAPRSQREPADPAFATVLGRLGEGQYLETPAAVVLSKADRYRFRPPVDKWLSRPPARSVDPGLIRQESRDVYGFLAQYDASAWLRPFRNCRRCTMHFASATGGEAVETTYPRGFRPRRVLEPLIALLAMCGVITGPDAEKVGR